jgi:hypothetical protein
LTASDPWDMLHLSKGGLGMTNYQYVASRARILGEAERRCCLRGLNAMAGVWGAKRRELETMARDMSIERAGAYYVARN